MTDRSAHSRSATLEDSVVWDGETVRILDRRVFPSRVEWVVAHSPQEVASAIRDMVTQSSGPLYAACAGMSLAAFQARDEDLPVARARLAAAGDALAHARPTNKHPKDAVEAVLRRTEAATSTPELVELAIDEARRFEADYRDAGLRLGRAAVGLLPRRATILTHCWAEAYLFGVVRAAEEAGTELTWVATETRPYLQGARLTAHSLRELDNDVTLITDGMAAAALSSPRGAGSGAIDAALTAADRVAMDGSVINKVGTLGIAAAAHAFDIPFIGLVEAPDPEAPTGADVVIEDRDPREVLEVLGNRTASELVTDAWYPAFDCAPPRLVSWIATSRGAFRPDRMADYFTTDPEAMAAPPLSPDTVLGADQ
ncbi:s-methyl-5-thioribose-1-phosphate isomerase [Microbacterium sediminicola]|uniref:S-methyl-5-thioribose-1-phosphate isomerase n=1 Tax=Microbacterium sediminicola TaxID=415210 RepID=A0ABN2IK74_9MICO